MEGSGSVEFADHSDAVESLSVRAKGHTNTAGVVLLAVAYSRLPQ